MEYYPSLYQLSNTGPDLHDSRTPVTPQGGGEKKAPFLKRHYFAETLTVFVLLGMLGVFMSLYATTANRNRPFVYQGRLMTSDYLPVADNTALNMKFRIYNAATLGTCLWGTGTQTAVTNNCDGGDGDAHLLPVSVSVTRGVFSVPLGDGSTNNPAFPFDFSADGNDYYLQVSIQTASGYDHPSPRIRIAGVPYAYNAQEVGGLATTQFLRSDVNTTLTQPTTIGGSAAAFTILGGNLSTLAAGTEASDILFDLNGAADNRTVQFAAGDITNQRALRIVPPSYSFVGASNILHAATVGIAGGPAAGTSATILRRIGLWITGENLHTAATGMNTFMRMNFQSAATLASGATLIGTHVDFDNAGELTVNGAGGQTVRGGIFQLPTSVNTNAAILTLTGFQVLGGEVSTNNASAISNWTGADIQIPTLSQGASGGTVTATGLSITAGSAAGANTSSYALVTNANAGSVGIGTITPAATALLELSSTTKGLLPPRMTTTQRDAVSSPAQGLLVYNTTNDRLEFKNSTAWTAPGGVTGGTANKLAYWTDTTTISANTNLSWDNSNTRLAIGNADPVHALEVTGTTLVSGRGAEKATNGDFALTTDWTLGTGWESPIAGGVANKNAAGTGTLSQNASEVSGEEYIVSFTLTCVSSCLVTASLGGHIGTARTTSGRYTEIFLAKSTADLTFTPTDTARFTLDNISVKKLSGENLLAMGAVGVGTTNPITQFHVTGLLPAGAEDTITPGANTNKVYVQGRYAYVVNAGANTLKIYDVSVPTSVSELSADVGSVTTGAGPRGLVIQGRYAYVTNFDTGTNGHTFQVFDVSNPLSPTLLSTTSTSGNNPQGLTVQGRYAYVGVQAIDKLQVYDISNPLSPTMLANVDTGDAPNMLAVQGQYVYITNSGANTLQIFDISNPAFPVSKSSITTGGSSSPGGIAVHGKYAYVVNPGTTNMKIFNIADPSAPVESSTISTSSVSHGIFVQGRYAYVSNFDTDTVQLFDVSTPTVPINMGTFAVGDGPTHLYVQGRHVYVPNFNAGTLSIYEVGGGYIQQLETGGFETDTGSVKNNFSVYNSLDVRGGLSVGNNGIFSSGAIGIFGTQPPSISTTPGKNASEIFTITGAIGGDTSITATGVGGNGSAITLLGGDGGRATAATTSSTGGTGGSILIRAGTGGNAFASASTRVGGNGGDLTLNGGPGGGSSGGTDGTAGKVLIATNGGLVGIGTILPLATLDINGGVIIRDNNSVDTVSGATTLTVGNRSYIRLSGSTPSPVVTLTDGLRRGQILILEATTGTPAIAINDESSSPGSNVDLAGSNWSTTINDTLTLIWNGTDWLELSRSAN